MKRSAIAVILLACGALLPAVGRAEPAAPTVAPAAAQAAVQEFTGFGKVVWGTRWEVAKKLLPTATEVPDGKDLGAANIGGPFVHRLYLTDQKFEGLPKPVNVELRFWKKKLWAVIVYFNDNDPKLVLAMLTKRLGPTQSTAEDNPLWILDKTQSSGTMSQKWFGITDSGLSKQAQAWFALVMTGQWHAPSQADLDEVEDRTPAPATAVPATPAAH